MFTFVARVCMCASRGARLCVYVGVCQEKSGGPEDALTDQQAKMLWKEKTQKAWRIVGVARRKKNNAHMPDLNIEVSMFRGGA